MADNLQEIFCPACKKKMTKIFMEEQNIYIDVCLDGCGGIYFDNREFYKFDEKIENIDELKEQYKNKTFQPIDENELRICPVCGARMVKHYANSKNKIEMDECYTCGGVFLDYSELSRIRESDKLPPINPNKVEVENGILEDEIQEYLSDLRQGEEIINNQKLNNSDSNKKAPKAIINFVRKFIC